jgi:hypothetical protein
MRRNVGSAVRRGQTVQHTRSEMTVLADPVEVGYSIDDQFIWETHGVILHAPFALRMDAKPTIHLVSGVRQIWCQQARVLKSDLHIWMSDLGNIPAFARLCLSCQNKLTKHGVLVNPVKTGCARCDVHFRTTTNGKSCNYYDCQQCHDRIADNTLTHLHRLHTKGELGGYIHTWQQVMVDQGGRESIEHLRAQQTKQGLKPDFTELAECIRDMEQTKREELLPTFWKQIEDPDYQHQYWKAEHTA